MKKFKCKNGTLEYLHSIENYAEYREKHKQHITRLKHKEQLKYRVWQAVMNTQYDYWEKHKICLESYKGMQK